MKAKSKRIPVGSLRFRMSVVVLFVILMLLALLLFNNIYAIQVVRNQVSDANQQAMFWYAEQLDDFLQDIDKYLVGLQTSSNSFRTVGHPRDEIEFQTAQATLKKEFEAALPSYRILDALYVYNPEKETFLDSSDYTISGSERSAVRQIIMDTLADGPPTGNGQWLVVQGGQQYYLLRLLGAGPVYYGAWIKLSNIIPEMYSDGLVGMEYLLFTTAGGLPLDTGFIAENGAGTLFGGAKNYTPIAGRGRYLLLSIPLNQSPICLVALVRDNSILDGLDSMQSLIRILVIVLLLLAPMFIWMVKWWMLQPLDGLVKAMQELGAGNLGVRMDAAAIPDEFLAVSQTFDAMSAQIKKLKIDVY